MKNRFLALALICLHLNPLQAIFPYNIFRLGWIDQTIKPYHGKQTLFKVSAEGAIKTTGQNNLDDHVNILHIWQDNGEQDALTMLRGFDANTQIGKLDSNLNSASDSSKRGHTIPTADLDAWRINFVLKHKLPYHLTINILMPVLGMKLKNVNWVDLTENLTFSDQLVKTNLMNNLAQTVYDLGNGLNITDGWEKVGMGDMEFILSWDKSFRQPKPILKNVQLGVYGGLTIPTGVRQNEDLLMSIPFGNDGSLGLIFGGNIQLQWWQHLRGGIMVNYLQLFGTTRERRVKTDANQTDLLLLAKTTARKGWGFTQQYNLYLEWHDLFANWSLRTAYNYIKHNHDRLSIFNQSYSNEIANTAASLQEWTQHSVTFWLRHESVIWADLHYILPFNGKAVIQSSFLGGSLGISF